MTVNSISLRDLKLVDRLGLGKLWLTAWLLVAVILLVNGLSWKDSPENVSPATTVAGFDNLLATKLQPIRTVKVG